MEIFKSQGRKFKVKNLKRMWFTKWLIHPIWLVDLLLPTWRWARKYKDFRYYHNYRSSYLKLQEVQTTHRENIVGMNTRKLFVGSDDSFYINLMQRIHLNTNVLNPMMAFWGALLNIDGAILGLSAERIRMAEIYVFTFAPKSYTGGYPLTWNSLSWSGLTQLLASVHVSGGFLP